MNKRTALLIAIVLVSMIFISGCAEQTAIKNQEEVSRAVTNVSTDVEDVATTLENIDRTLSGG